MNTKFVNGSQQLTEDDPLALNLIQYWQLNLHLFPIIAKFAIDIMTILAAAADCERTFSELGDLLGTWRLRRKSELLAELQSIKNWKRIGIELSTTSNTGAFIST